MTQQELYTAIIQKKPLIYIEAFSIEVFVEDVFEVCITTDQLLKLRQNKLKDNDTILIKCGNESSPSYQEIPYYKLNVKP